MSCPDNWNPTIFLQFILNLSMCMHLSRNSATVAVYRGTSNFGDLVLLKPVLNFRMASWAETLLQLKQSCTVQFVDQFVFFLDILRHLSNSCYFFQKWQHQNGQIRIPFGSTADTATCDAHSYLKSNHCHDRPVLGWESHGAHLTRTTPNTKTQQNTHMT